MNYRNNQMRQNLPLITFILLLPCLISAEPFENFLKSFFIDSSFQVNHIRFPLKGEISFISGDNSTAKIDTIFASSITSWEYMSYGYGRPNVNYSILKELPKPLSGQKNLTYISLEEEETDFNLNLGFVKNKDTWVLIFMSYFEP